jgi:hypothetical protein
MLTYVPFIILLASVSYAMTEAQLDTQVVPASITSSYTDRNAVVKLLGLRTTNPEVFARRCAMLIYKKIGQLLELLLYDKELREQSMGTPIDLDTLIMITIVSAYDEESGRGSCTPWDIFIKHGQEYHKKYAIEIINTLHKLLHQRPYCYADVLPFLNSHVQSLRQAAFKEFTDYTLRSKNVSYHNSMLREFLSTDFTVIACDMQSDRLDIYVYLYMLYKKNAYHHGMQHVLVALAQAHNTEDTEVCKLLWADYLSLDATATQGKSLTECCTAALKQAYATQSLDYSTLKCILRLAAETGFDQYIDPAFYATQVSDVTLALPTRASVLHVALENIILSGQENSSIVHRLHQFNERVEVQQKGLFKQYTQALITSVTPGESIYTNFGAQRQLLHIAQQEVQLDPQPTILRCCSHRIVQAFIKDYTMKSVRQLEANSHHIQVSDDYVYYMYTVDDTTRLYACEIDTGYAVWYTPPYTPDSIADVCYVVGRTELYLVPGDGSLVIINRFTGEVKNRCALDGTGPVRFMMHAQNNWLYVVYAGIINCINLTESSGHSFKYTSSMNDFFYQIGESLGIYSRPWGLLYMYNYAQSNPTHKISINDYCNPEWLALENNLMVYPTIDMQGKTDTADNNTLGCYTIKNTAKQWSIPFTGGFVKATIASESNCVYTATSTAVAAFDLSSGDAIWQVPYRDKGIIVQMLVSQDNKKIYVVYRNARYAESTSSFYYVIDCMNDQGLVIETFGPYNHPDFKLIAGSNDLLIMQKIKLRHMRV